MRSERGSVSVHAVTLAAALLVVVLVIVQVVALVRLRHEVTAAADLAALAGSRASAGGEDGCAAAREVARRNGPRLATCRMDLDVATVTVRQVARPWWGGRWEATARARAAPAHYLPP